MREHHRKVVAWLESVGASAIRLDHRHKHTHIRFTWNNVARKYVTSATPSDRLATLNTLADLRHMLGLVNTARKISQRRAARKPPKVETARPVLTFTPRADWREALHDHLFALDIPPIPAHARRVT